MAPLALVLFFVVLGLGVVLAAMKSGRRGPLLDADQRTGRRPGGTHVPTPARPMPRCAAGGRARARGAAAARPAAWPPGGGGGGAGAGRALRRRDPGRRRAPQRQGADE